MEDGAPHSPSVFSQGLTSVFRQDAYPMGAQDTDLVLRVKALKRGYHRKVTLDRFSDLLGGICRLGCYF